MTPKELMDRYDPLDKLNRMTYMAMITEIVEAHEKVDAPVPDDAIVLFSLVAEAHRAHSLFAASTAILRLAYEQNWNADEFWGERFGAFEEAVMAFARERVDD